MWKKNYISEKKLWKKQHIILFYIPIITMHYILLVYMEKG